jgi:hypothetical protein
MRAPHNNDPIVDQVTHAFHAVRTHTVIFGSNQICPVPFASLNAMDIRLQEFQTSPAVYRKTKLFHIRKLSPTI